jgi:diaminopimelate decarboxylase
MYGPLCMNIDVVRDTCLPPVDVGDRVVFRNVGAYNVTQWMQFITYRPAVVMIARDGQVSLIRRRETLDERCWCSTAPCRSCSATTSC